MRGRLARLVLEAKVAAREGEHVAVLERDSSRGARHAIDQRAAIAPALNKCDTVVHGQRRREEGDGREADSDVRVRRTPERHRVADVHWQGTRALATPQHDDASYQHRVHREVEDGKFGPHT